MSLDENSFVCAMDHPDILLVDWWGQNDLVSFQGHIENNFAVKFLTDSTFVSGGEDLTVRIWDIWNSKESLHIFAANCSPIGDFLYHDKS